jgi:TctA family transporter
MISHGDFGVFFTRPVSLVFLLGALVFLSAPLLKSVWQRTQGQRGKAQKE